MNPRIKANWIAALRSGKYRRTTHSLRDQRPGKHIGYCCLGVLCDTLKEELKGKWDITRAFNYHINNEANCITGTLGDNLAKYVELTPRSEATLIKMNDKEELSFKEIADYIEYHL